jgi:uncharacterized NAD-dependent epimerase/dehydratase family protein
MMVGKMSAAWELNCQARKAAFQSEFIATGQDGLMLSGQGIALDAVPVDSAAAAVEELVFEHSKTNDILFIEGQGSILHPGSTLTLPLLRGAQPTHMILVHRPADTFVNGIANIKIPDLNEVISLYETLASAGGTLPGAKVCGIALNTAHLSSSSAIREILKTEKVTGLPCGDVVRFDTHDLLTAIVPKVEPWVASGSFTNFTTSCDKSTFFY